MLNRRLIRIKVFKALFAFENSGSESPATVAHLKEQRVIGFDTETRPVFQPHVPRNHTALLQLASETRAYLFRLHSLGLPQSVVDILSDPYISRRPQRWPCRSAAVNSRRRAWMSSTSP